MIKLQEYCKFRGFNLQQVRRFIIKGKFSRETWARIDGEIIIDEKLMDQEVKKFRPKRSRFPGPRHWLGSTYRRSWLQDH